MAKAVTDIKTLRRYIHRVVGKAEHHGGEVKGVVLAVLGAIIWCSSGQIKVREYKEKMANMAYFKVGKKNYVAKYSHEGKGSVEILADTQIGEILISFNDSTRAGEIYEFFHSLKS